MCQRNAWAEVLGGVIQTKDIFLSPHNAEHKDNLQLQLGLQVATKPPRKPLQEGVNN